MGYDETMPTPYSAPLAMMRIAIDQAAEIAGLRTMGTHAEALGELTDTVLESAARMAREILSPLNRIGDASGCELTASGVRTPAGFPEAYRRFCADGWPSLTAPAELGGQALPALLAAATTEMWGAANLALAMCPESATGAIEAIRTHAAQSLRDRSLPPLVSGEWTAAMSLTEPQAGSDLSTLRTSAEPDGEAWRLKGRKLFISWADHDLAENIVHLVLARAADAPPGVKGISLFLMPKVLPDGSRNDIQVVSLEHKMGIRASPTCALVLGERGGARGWLVGKLHDGLACMFTMMNHMRLGVALHSTGLAERARQLAHEYATERRQGRDAAGAQVPIIRHADVRRMLLATTVLTHAARCLAYTGAATLDAAQCADSGATRTRAGRRLALLTPLAKAWCSDTAVEVASLAVQVHGGTGYVDDSEVSQVYRDARIGPIFEGTNYMQAQDLLLRRVLRDDGVALDELLTEVESSVAALPPGQPQLAALGAPLIAECRMLRDEAQRLKQATRSEPELAGCVAYPFLQWLAVVAGGWQWAVTARESARRAETDARMRALIDCAAFYAAHILPRARLHAAAVAAGSETILAPQLGAL
jgi:acyl-CoA dehydrogenase